MESDPQTVLDKAIEIGLPVVWFKIGHAFAVVIEGELFTQSNEFDSFFVYFTSFSVYGIQWDSMCNLNGSKKRQGFPNRKCLELIHWYV